MLGCCDAQLRGLRWISALDLDLRRSTRRARAAKSEIDAEKCCCPPIHALLSHYEAMSKVEDVAGESDFKTLNRWIMDHTTDMEARAAL